MRRFALAAALVSLATGCVVVPYQPKSETTRDLADVPDSEAIRLSVGPRRLLEEVREALRDADARIEPLDGQTFIDAAAPDGQLSLARLLEPGTRERIAPLEADYLVVVGEPRGETLDSSGAMLPMLGFWGAAREKVSSTYWAAVVDLREMAIIEQLTTTSSGTDTGVGFFYGVFIVSDTDGSARKGVIRDLAHALSGAKPEGPVRVVLLAKETIRTPEEIASAERQQELERRRTTFRLPGSVQAYPPFSEPPPPEPGEGLILLYRPYEAIGSLFPLVVRTGSGASEFQVTQLWSGGYLAYRTPAGTVKLWPESDPGGAATLTVEAGGTYYVEGLAHLGWNMPRFELKVADPHDARREVLQCRRVPTMREAVEEARALAEQGYTQRQVELARFYTTGVPYAPGAALPLDRVAAYQWYTAAAATEGSPDWLRKMAESGAEALRPTMSADEIAEGYRRGLDWLQTFEREFQVAPPAERASTVRGPVR